MADKLDELVHAPHVLAVHGQLVALQVEILERVVILEGLAELGGALGAEQVLLELELPEGGVLEEDLSDDDAVSIVQLL